MRMVPALLAAFLLFAVAAISSPARAAITTIPWGETPEHQKVELYTLTNTNGVSVKLSTYGAVI